MDARKIEISTYEDWLSLSDGVQAELIDGLLTMMAQPSTNHQIVLLELAGRLREFLKGKTCRVFPAPFGVRLESRYGGDDVFEPDVSVVCDKSKLTKYGCDGAPDLVVEILSPSTAKYDKVIKFNKYLQAGVREYWLVDIDSKTLLANTAKDGEWIGRAYGEEDKVPVTVLPGCVIDLGGVFGEMITELTNKEEEI